MRSRIVNHPENLVVVARSSAAWSPSLGQKSNQWSWRALATSGNAFTANQAALQAARTMADTVLAAIQNS